METTEFVRGSLVSLLVLCMFGCAVEPLPRIVWPTPPEQERFEWVGTFKSEASFKKDSSLIGEMAQRLGEKFKGPVGVAVNIDDRILVSDIYNQSILHLDLENKTITEFTKYQFRNNLGIATDQQGHVYVADGKTSEIVVFDKDGLLLFTIGGKEIFKKPSFLAVNDELGRLYVSDAKAHQIMVFSLDGELLFSFGEPGDGPGQFFAPQGLAFDSHGKLFVADMLNARIQVFSADGEYLRHFGERGNFPQQMENPKDLAFDSEDHLYLTDSRRPVFRVLDPDGTLLLVVGGGKRDDHQLGFQLPVGIYVDRFDRVFITDLMNGRVTVWQALSKAYQQRSQSQ
jgi:sugar lactone lactonase YvrE